MARSVSEARLLRAEHLLLQLGQVLGIRLRIHSDVAGDRWVAECVCHFVEEHGSEKVRDMSKSQLPYDLLVDGFRVQCKARTPKPGRRMSIEKWWGKPRNGGNSFDFLALKYGDAHYVIPSYALLKTDGNFKNDIKPDRFWKYRDKWRLENLVAASPCGSDLPLFSCDQRHADGR